MLNYYKTQGLNLYLVKDKLPSQIVGNKLVGITGWQDLKDFSKYTKQIKDNDNFGFFLNNKIGKYLTKLEKESFNILNKPDYGTCCCSHFVICTLPVNLVVPFRRIRMYLLIRPN